MKKIAILLALSALTTSAWSINMNVFKDAPVTRLTGEEVKAFRATVMKTLDETPDGATVEWRAPKTRFVSKITPQRSFSDGKLKCRDAVIESDAHDRFQRGLYTFCKGAKGDWGFKSVGGQSKSK
jgi:surface antigen